MSWLWTFLQEEDGPTSVEYAVMMALIIITCVASIGLIGQETVQLMNPGGKLTGTLSAGS